MLIPNQTSKTDQNALERDERKTTELCGDSRGSHRCILARGHVGNHECHTAVTVHSWK